MLRIKTRPVYTPDSKIEGQLYTSGKEYMFADTFEEYIGLYHRYPNKAIYSEAEWIPERSRALIQYVDQSSNEPLLDEKGDDKGGTTNNNSIYFKITEKRFNNYYTPPYHYPEPTNEQYDVGFMDRYFAGKINEDIIIEVTSEEYDRRNTNNEPGIDQNLYRFVVVKWTIDGPLDQVRKANARVIQYAEQIEQFPGLALYLSDLDEYHKNRHKVVE